MESDRQEFPAFLSIFCHTPPVETGPNSLTTLAAFSDSVPDVWGHRSTQGHKGEGGGRIEGELGGGGGRQLSRAVECSLAWEGK